MEELHILEEFLKTSNIPYRRLDRWCIPNPVMDMHCLVINGDVWGEFRVWCNSMSYLVKPVQRLSSYGMPQDNDDISVFLSANDVIKRLKELFL